MRIINYFDSDRKDYWLGEIQKCDWEAARFLYDMLSNGTFLAS